MSRPAAQAAAGALLVSAGVAAAYVVITTPSLRRLVVGSTRLWLGSSVPAYLLREIGRAWVESDRTA
ncbi:MAG: hypothetical protein JSU08_09005 [Acidobacteria bacterium]|nr:hypothetical protein [Acidobacteriota bacterium]